MKENQYAAFKKSADEFIKHFLKKKDKRIAIYGIGQYTAALLPRLDGFHIVGLMDGDPSNIGKTIYGYQILSLEEAEKGADFIVINTSAFYREMIFQRIENSKIPIYYSNGERAYKRQKSFRIDEKCKVSFADMKRQIDEADLVSFDFYDTLVMRLVYSPGDIFKITEKRIKNTFDNDMAFAELRNTAAAELEGKEYTLDEIYQRMETYVDKSACERMKILEIDTEMKLTVARKEMATLFEYANEAGKEIYILSDMYLPGEVIKRVAGQCGINIEKANLWISCEVGKSKRSGELWEMFARKTKGRKSIHFGDSFIGDEEKPRNFGIKTIHIPSPIELLKNCSLVKITPYINLLHSSLAMGILLNEMFNNPFIYEKAGETLEISACKTFGKCVFGDITFTYLWNILSEVKKQKIEQLIFFARDGYFLRQDFDRLCKQVGVNVPCSYLLVSRKMILSAASEDEAAYSRLVKSDYNGYFSAYLQDRFGVEIDENDPHINQKCCMPNDYSEVCKWLKPYEKSIHSSLALYRRNYKRYLEQFDWSKETAVVDICYTGSIQYWLSRIINKKMTGFYFVADLSEENRFQKANQMLSCFQDKDDMRAEKSYIWKNHKLVESLYTAPYGMVKSVDEYGNFETYPLGNNQKNFVEREQMNTGINEFISEYIETCKGIGLDLYAHELDYKFTDALLGVFFDGDIVYGEAIRNCFWHEDCFINSTKEYSLF